MVLKSLIGVLVVLALAAGGAYYAHHSGSLDFALPGSPGDVSTGGSCGTCCPLSEPASCCESTVTTQTQECEGGVCPASKPADGEPVAE